MKTYIKIILEDENGKLLAVRTTQSWEIAEMNLDSLKRRYEKGGGFRDDAWWNKEKKEFIYKLVERS